MGIVVRKVAEIEWLTPPPGFFHKSFSALSLRRGGVSPPPYDTLNLGRSAGDFLDRVDENESRLARAIGLPGEPARAYLAHGDRCAVVERPGVYRGVDGLATSVRGLPLWLTVADCYAVFVEAGNWIGLLHCGWRGTAAGAVGVLARLLALRSGTPTSGMRAWIGPGIGSCCYPVGDDVAARFASEWITRRHGVAHLDLGGAIEMDLLAAGVVSGSLERSRLCTSCNPAILFSYRRDGPRSGRMAAVIWLPD